MSEGRALAHHAPAGAPAAVRSESAGVLAMVIQAAKDPTVDAAKVETMANLAMKLQDRERESEFNRDLNAAIMEMPVITKGGIITIPAKDGRPARTQGRFARFEDIDRVVRPILQRHNLALRFEVDESSRGVVSVRPILSHANGHTERGGTMHLPLDDSGAKNKVQGVGSAVQYGKRYTMCALLNIVTEGTDDDGSLGRFNIDMPHERGETVLQEAEQAAAEGRYSEFFAAQGVKDRAWLVGQGHHARLGGGTELPAPETRAAPASTRREPAPAKAAEPAATGAGAAEAAQTGPATKAEITPLEWVERFEGDLGKITDVDQLDVYVDGKNAALTRLREKDVALHDRALASFRARRAAIADGRLV